MKQLLQLQGKIVKKILFMSVKVSAVRFQEVGEFFTLLLHLAFECSAFYYTSLRAQQKLQQDVQCTSC